MKKLLVCAVSLMSIFLFTAFSFADGNIMESAEIKIIIDGKAGTYANVPISVNGSTLLPLRELAVNLGVPNDDGHIIWNGLESSVTLIKDAIKIYLKVGSGKATINGTETSLDAAPVEYKDKVYIPARFIAQSFGKKVDWDEKTNSVIISENGNAVKEVTVSTAQEFVNEIGSNKKIVLKPGIYDLSAIEQVTGSDFVKWEEVNDGKELNIKNIDNLTIEGSLEGTTEIRVTPRYAHIMAFESCRNVTIKNITAGHTPAEYECDAGVLNFANSEDIIVDNSHLYGSGSIGVSLWGVKNFTCSNTLIDHCSLRAVYINKSEAVKFTDCKILNHEAYSNIIAAVSSKDIIFEGCEMSGNNNFGWGFVEASYNSDITLSKCKITNNSQMVDSPMKSDKVYFFLTVDYAQSPNNRIVVRDSEISGNKCDYLTDDKDAVTFENCTMNNNKWK